MTDFRKMYQDVMMQLHINAVLDGKTEQQNTTYSPRPPVVYDTVRDIKMIKTASETVLQGQLSKSAHHAIVMALDNARNGRCTDNEYHQMNALALSITQREHNLERLIGKAKLRCQDMYPTERGYLTEYDRELEFLTDRLNEILNDGQMLE